MTNFEYYVAGRRANEGWHEFLTNYYKNKKGADRAIDQYNKWLLEEYDPHIILDDIEKEYLSNVIKPFRKRVHYIYKRKYNLDGFRCRIVIALDDSVVELPPFDCKKMYAGMKPYVKYTLKELDL